jgi:hypothetical protein
MRVASPKVAVPGVSPAARRVGTLNLIALLLVAGCDRPIAGPGASPSSPGQVSGDVSATVLTTYTDRAAWEGAVAAASGTVQNMNFSGLTQGRVTQADTDYGDFRLVVDHLSATSSSNPGLDFILNASCFFGTGDCHVFTLNMIESTSLLDMPKSNQLIFDQPVMAFGGNFFGVGFAGTSVTGPVTIHFGTETVVVNSSLDASGNGFFGFISTTPVSTIEFTYGPKTGTLQNDLFQIYNPAYANGVTPPPTSTPEEMIADLRELIDGLDLKRGDENHLDRRLRDGLKQLEREKLTQACHKLDEFIKDVRKRAGKKMSEEDAAVLIEKANEIKTEIGC